MKLFSHFSISDIDVLNPHRFVYAGKGGPDKPKAPTDAEKAASAEAAKQAGERELTNSEGLVNEVKSLESDTALTRKKVEDGRAKIDVAIKSATDAMKDVTDPALKERLAKLNQSADGLKRSLDTKLGAAEGERKAKLDRLTEQYNRLHKSPDAGDKDASKALRGAIADVLHEDREWAHGFDVRDAIDKVFIPLDNDGKHDFEGNDEDYGSKAKEDYVNQYEMYDNGKGNTGRSIAMAHGYAMALMAMRGTDAGSAEAKQAFADLHDKDGSTLDHTITEAALLGKMKVDAKDIEAVSKMAGGDGAFVVDMAPATVAVYLQTAKEKFGADSDQYKKYEAYVKDQLTAISPTLKALGKKANDSVAENQAYDSQAEAKGYVENVRNQMKLVMSCVPTPDDFAKGGDGMKKYEDFTRPEAKTEDLEAWKAKLTEYRDLIKTVLGKWDEKKLGTVANYKLWERELASVESLISNPRQSMPRSDGTEINPQSVDAWMIKLNDLLSGSPPAPDGGGTGGKGGDTPPPAPDGGGTGGKGGGGREGGPDKEKTPFERRTEALNDLRKNHRLETLTLPVDNPYLSIDPGGKITYKKKLLDALNQSGNWKIPLSDIVKPKDGVKIDVAGDGKNDVAVGNGNEFVNENGSDKDSDKKGDISYIGEGYVLKLKPSAEKKVAVAKTMVWDSVDEGTDLYKKIKALPEKYQQEYQKILNNPDTKNFGIIQINDRVKRGELSSPHECTVDGVKFYVSLGSPVDARVKMPVDGSSNMNTTWSTDAARKNVVTNMNFWLYDRILKKAEKEKAPATVSGDGKGGAVDGGAAGKPVGAPPDGARPVEKGADVGKDVADKKAKIDADIRRFDAKISEAKAELQKGGGKRVVYVGEILDGRLPVAARPEVSYDATKKTFAFTYESKACKDEAEFKQKIRAGVEKYYEGAK